VGTAPGTDTNGTPSGNACPPGQVNHYGSCVAATTGETKGAASSGGCAAAEGSAGPWATLLTFVLAAMFLAGLRRRILRQ